MLRLLLTPPWLLRSALGLLTAALMALLALWQVERARGPAGSATNWAYAAEWLFFSLFTLFFLWRWAREVRDTAEGRVQQAPPVPDPPPLPGTATGPEVRRR